MKGKPYMPMSSPFQQVTRQEAQAYWERHHALNYGFDREHDPEGLSVVGEPGAPLFANRYYSCFQRRVYADLLRLALKPRSGARALDIGCGTGRWCRFLASQGFQVLGLDLDDGLIEANRRRHPQMDFVSGTIQNFDSQESFDLISSVTVLQHIPYEDQGPVIHKLGRLTRRGGFLLALENVRDRGMDVFANTIDGWKKKIIEGGFQVVALRRYDYNPCLTLLRRAWQFSGSSGTGLVQAVPFPGLDGHPNRETALAQVKKTVKKIGYAAALATDYGPEAALVAGNVGLPSRHCGFLCRAI